MRDRGMHLGFGRAASFLCCGLLLAGNIFADAPPDGHDLHIETTTTELLGEEEAARYRRIVPTEKTISWEVYLPNGASSEPPGVFVYISPRASGKINPRWREVMDRENLIYIGANKSGNRIHTNRRMVLATLAIKVLAEQYVFDIRKMIVSGFSGGGRVASLVASQYPEVFTGAVYICGANFWKKNQTRNVKRVLQNRFVFLTGTQDFNLLEMRRTYEHYLEAGAENSKLIVVPGMSHDLPDAAYLTEAVDFLLGGDPP
ncbi:MAG: hypothetical protein PVJ33_04100 [Lysobacterales bacterium]